MTATESGSTPDKNDITEFEVPDNIGKIFDDHLELLQVDTLDELYTTFIGTVQSLQGINTTFLSTALETAQEVHHNDVRQVTKLPYLVHPIRVALLAVRLAQEMKIPVTNELIASALLHDTIEDSPLHEGTPVFNQQSLTDTYLAGFEESLIHAVAQDAEALNHNTVKKGNIVDSEKYYQKIHSEDRNTFIRRQIIKAADRIDNLLDPPTLPIKGGIIDGEETSAKLLKEKRPLTIEKTKDPFGIINRLLPNNTVQGNFLGGMVQIAIYISEATITDRTFTLSLWRKHVPHTAYARFAK